MLGDLPLVLRLHLDRTTRGLDASFSTGSYKHLPHVEFLGTFF
jgi:hypothetical protein